MYRATWQFNQAVRIRGGDLLFVSGIVGLAPDGSIATDDIVEQSQVAFENLSMVLEEAGGSLADVIKVNVYVGESYSHRRDDLRKVRARFFTGDYPVSTLIQVAGFANPEYLFEVEAIAVLDSDG
ncbi:MAG: RidA family protein [Acidimicrobiales bacterium]|nr:RidA family protein [Acidimicrobiales bacterium]